MELHLLSSQPISSCALYQVLHLTLKEKKGQKIFSTEQSFLLLWKGHEAGVLLLKYPTADF